MKDNVILNKLLVCAYVIIALLTINTFVLIVSNVDTKKSTASTTTTTEKNDEYDVSMFNSIDGKGFNKLLKSEKTSVIYLGRSTCGYCVKFLPVLQKAQKEIGYKTNYVDISAVDESSDETTKMINSINAMAETYNKENGTNYDSLYGYTPTVVIVGNGKIKSVWIGYSEYEAYASWLSNNGIK